MTPEPTLWRIASRTPLRWRRFDSEWVVFHPDSGDTHLLDPAASTILRMLEAGPASAAALVERLSRDESLSIPHGLAESVAQILRAFDEVGLIEPGDDSA